MEDEEEQQIQLVFPSQPAHAQAPQPQPHASSSSQIDLVLDDATNDMARPQNQAARRRLIQEGQRRAQNDRLAESPQNTAACLQAMNERERTENVGGARFYQPTMGELDRCVAGRNADERAAIADAAEDNLSESGTIGRLDGRFRSDQDQYADALGNDEQARILLRARANGHDIPTVRAIETQQALRNQVNAGPVMAAGAGYLAARDIADGEQVHSMTSASVNELADTLGPVEGLVGTANSVSQGRIAGREAQSGRRSSVVGLDGPENDGLQVPEAIHRTTEEVLAHP